MFQRWLRSGKNEDRQRYILQRRLVNSAMKKAKNEWMQEKARGVEVEMLSRGSLGCMQEKGRAVEVGMLFRGSHGRV